MWSRAWERQPPPRADRHARARIRELRARAGLLLAVLDDDPTGSQAVHGVQLVTALERGVYDDALRGESDTCFVLTNTRSLDAPAAVRCDIEVAGDLYRVAEHRGRRLQLVSRSDSTLRGHVLEEVAALHEVRRSRLGAGFDGVLFAPAYLEAGRVTAGDVHWARVGDQLVPVGETEFARDASFGYRSSNLREFLAERSGGEVPADSVHSLSLSDIREGGPDRVRQVLSGVGGGAWVVVNATEYSDLETVALGVLAAQERGQSFLFRTGPSFVRALAGLEPSEPLRTEQIWPDGAPPGHGLIVVGSHVGQSTRQLAALRARGSTVDVELDVAALVSGGPDRAEDLVLELSRRVVRALPKADVLLYTSRTVIGGDSATGGAAGGATGATGSLAVARDVSHALAGIVRRALAARPAWVVGKGGITSHDVATHGLGIRRAEVVGQLLPGVVSVLRPLDAPAETLGVPYVVFAGNVGDDGTLGYVVDVLRGGKA
ncbi:hypothetical protein Raf01_59620 [Rugosimonospora africana]|uniref:Four-carbon acid sugar kinase family protein n=1 Tax=Rugosimonospora africana TaxID=556532 RepID=A0A8J3QUM5_9ACTN|nr:hypothetical protein Raf01_59620 [Rugosimonospora africana]